MTEISRRRFLATTGGATFAAATGIIVPSRAGAAGPVSRVDGLPTGLVRTWIGPEYWANRLQDWRLAAGRIECLAATAVRTVGVLTRTIEPGASSATLTVPAGTLSGGAGGSGFLIGAGAGALDWRAAALVMGASGEGGGILALYEQDGKVRFREHTDEAHQFACAVLASAARRGTQPARSTSEDVTLQLDITPIGAGRFDLTLSARRTSNGVLLSTTTRTGVPDAQIVGGVSLVSNATGSTPRARYWFRELQTGGAKIAVHDGRRVGPILATQYSVSDDSPTVGGGSAGSVLKVNAQVLPLASSEPQELVLQVRREAGAWSEIQRAPIGPGWCALFRVARWDASRDCEYRVVHAPGTPAEATWGGVVRRSPTDRQVSVGMVNCTIHAFRWFDAASPTKIGLPGEQTVGLWTPRNLYYPYAETVEGLLHADPDMFVASGDQYYEDCPNMPVVADVALDVLYRYSMWLMSFRELTRSRPSVTLVDDHDVYHSNLWGWSGRAAPNGSAGNGGYVMPPAWVNLVQRMQCGHNPDAYDATPVLQGISVYYGAFSWGGVSFAVLEDRKFKNTNKTGTDGGVPLPPPRDLLGARHERFLTAWADLHPGQPKVCLTQTVFGCVQTNPQGKRNVDSDSNGTPAEGRRTAVTLLKRAKALVLSGDQHLGSLVRHGITSFTDGPLQFTPPAAGTAWQRWFQPSPALPNGNGPNTGDFTDGFGNKMRVLAVTNPLVTFAQVRALQSTNRLGDRRLKREGYGIVEIDLAAQEHRIHCWPWNADPTAAGADEFDGWPYTLPFAHV